MALAHFSRYGRSTPARQSYRSLAESDHESDSEPDVEKRASQNYDYNYSASTSSRHSESSSRRTSDSYYLPPPRRKLLAWARPSVRFRRNYGRIFTFVLGSTLVALAVTLWRQSAASAREVEQGFQHVQPQPHAWESFPLLERYYGGIRSLVTRDENVPEFPNEREELAELADLANRNRSDDAAALSAADRRRGSGLKQMAAFDPFPTDKGRKECFLDEQETIGVPGLHAFPGVVKGMPDPLFGSLDTLGMKNDVCFDRFGRLGPYGLGYSEKRGGSGAGLEGDREGIDAVWSDTRRVDWSKVRLGEAQARCVRKNSHRFEKPTNETLRADGQLPRTAVLIRTWHDYEYDAEDLFYLRALVSELSLNSGGEHEVHFLVHVKDNDLPIWADEATYNSVLNASLPQEFAGMGTLWSERQMSLIYGGLAETMYADLSVHGVYRSAFMPVQYFAHRHPEFEHFWHWEMDVRYVGHYYELVDKVSRWARAQPRKGLWERNARFYIPSEHGSWDDFRHMVRVQTEHGTGHSWKNGAWAKMAGDAANLPSGVRPTEQAAETPVWGAVEDLAESDRFETESEAVPPHSYKQDADAWGAGEEADLIVFSPIFDPTDTDWTLAHDYTGYNVSSGPPPRRASIGTTGRYSRRLLATMHRETALARHAMSSEMWPASACLHHGLKAVFAPHPVQVDRRWPTSLAAIYPKRPAQPKTAQR
ncbi:MAG: DUF3405 domain-containing protein, partial [Terriglobus roseus]|nr:DUF3405 domain-containing protein [Terriglobus roseus]